MTSPAPTICRLGPDDMAAMLRLFAEAIAPAQLARSIYSAPGAQGYLELLARSQPLLWHEQLWGIKDEGGQLIAAAHTRSQCQGSHLNNFAVAPWIQARGLGSLMMRHWEDLARAEGAPRLTLDVSEENSRARGLYEHFGFSDVAITHEYRIQPPPAPKRPSSLRLLGWPQALATLAAYGFGRFQVELDCTDHFVDLLPGRFRCSNPDETFLGALRWIDPEREILLRSSGSAGVASWPRTGALVRMQKDLPSASAAPPSGRTRTPTDAIP